MPKTLQYHRRQLYDRSRETFVDEPIPTEPVRITKIGRSTYTKGVGSVWAMGSYNIGTEQTLQIVFEEFSTNTPNVYFRIRHDKIGTIDTPYLESAGQETRIGGIFDPLESIGTSGYLRVDALGPFDGGKYQGIGSVGNINIGAKVVGYFI
ncbi:MAG: hypothetical protein QMC85_06945 [Methanocellales archaeon]|nr:hypothetical protein [Methanocellales archaeon]